MGWRYLPVPDRSEQAYRGQKLSRAKCRKNAARRKTRAGDAVMRPHAARSDELAQLRGEVAMLKRMIADAVGLIECGRTAEGANLLRRAGPCGPRTAGGNDAT